LRRLPQASAIPSGKRSRRRARRRALHTDGSQSRRREYNADAVLSAGGEAGQKKGTPPFGTRGRYSFDPGRRTRPPGAKRGGEAGQKKGTPPFGTRATRSTPAGGRVRQGQNVVVRLDKKKELPPFGTRGRRSTPAGGRGPVRQGQKTW